MSQQTIYPLSCIWSSMKGLLFSKVYLDKILNGEVGYDARMHPCNVRGPIALVEKESRTIRGTAVLTGVRPITYQEFAEWHLSSIDSDVPLAATPFQSTRYAYDLSDVRSLSRPMDSGDRDGHMWIYIPEELQHLIGY